MVWLFFAIKSKDPDEIWTIFTLQFQFFSEIFLARTDFTALMLVSLSAVHHFFKSFALWRSIDIHLKAKLYFCIHHAKNDQYLYDKSANVLI